MSRGSARWAAGLAIAGEAAVLLCLYVLAWYEPPCPCTFLELASEQTDVYGTSSAPDPLNAFGNAFFEWGHVLFALAGAAGAVAIVKRRSRPAVGLVAAAVAGAIWFAIARAQPGFIDYNAAASLAYVGVVALVVALVVLLAGRSAPAAGPGPTNSPTAD